MAEFEDKQLTCVECNSSFTFSAGEQQKFHQLIEKGEFTEFNEPKRCPTCRLARRNRNTGSGTKELFDVICADCGDNAKVPFKPRTDKPVYCSPCFEKRR